MRTAAGLLTVSLLFTGCGGGSHRAAGAPSPSPTLELSDAAAACAGNVEVPFQVSLADILAGRDADAQAQYQKIIDEFGTSSLEFHAFNVLNSRTRELEHASFNEISDAALAACGADLPATAAPSMPPPAPVYSAASVPAGLPQPPDPESAPCTTILGAYAPFLLTRRAVTRQFLLDYYAGSALNPLQEAIDMFLADPTARSATTAAVAHACAARGA